MMPEPELGHVRILQQDSSAHANPESPLTSHPCFVSILGAMFDTGDRVLVRRPGTRLHQLRRTDRPTANATASARSSYSFPSVFLAWDAELQYPMDAAAEEPMRKPGNHHVAARVDGEAAARRSGDARAAAQLAEQGDCAFGPTAMDRGFLRHATQVCTAAGFMAPTGGAGCSACVAVGIPVPADDGDRRVQGMKPPDQSPPLIQGTPG